jgi:PKD repeat protein
MFPCTTRRRFGRKVFSGFVSLTLAMSVLAVVHTITAPHVAAAPVPPVVDSASNHVTADPLPTVQINGVVWDQEIVGNTVYAVGQFTQARPAGAPAGSNQTARGNVLAYNLTTGALIQGFVANTNAQVKSVTVSPDGSRIYIAGQFTRVNGITRNRIAALNPTTGAVITSFNPQVSYNVNDLVVTDDVVYAGGAFGQAGGQTRQRLAAFSTSTGALTSWSPDADATVETLLMSPDGSRLYAGGHFLTINGQSAHGMGAINPQNGALIPWAANQVVRNGGPNGAILHLFTDGTSIYGNGYRYGSDGGNSEGVFKAHATTGAILWIDDCHGDTYKGWAQNGYVYKAGHFHFCGNINGQEQTDDEYTQWGENMRHAMSLRDQVSGTVRRDGWGYYNWEGRPAPSVAAWSPQWQIGSFTGINQATWSVEGNDQYVLYGGEFPRVNGVNQQGLVRFAVRSIAPNNSGPLMSGSSFPIKVASPAAGQAQVSFPANVDRDDLTLTYQIQRDGSTVHTTTADSTFWDRPTVSFLDTGRTPGQNHTYRVRVVDGDGNSVLSDTENVTIRSSGAPTTYANRVIADGARLYWRLGDSSGSSQAQDAAAFQTGTVNNMTFGRPGAIIGDPNTAARPNSTSSRIVSPPLINRQGLPEANPVVDEFSLEVWFRANGSGGRLLGFGSSPNGSSGSSQHDRLLYVSDAGRVLFGMYTRPEGSGYSGSRVRRTIQSPAGFDDGDWHHAVATIDGNGMRLYVDGAQVAQRTDVNSGHGYYGYWRVGADTMSSGWSGRPSSVRLNGDIDEAAVYYHVLTPAEVANHWNLSGHGSGGNAAPTASFSWTADDLTASFDASASDDDDGNVVSYAWSFGDGDSGSGVSPNHSYDSPGSYLVTLTVTDDDGATDQTSRTVDVEAPPGGNLAPTASFTVSQDDLDIGVDASGSDDPDGTIVSYEWDFGDGGTDTGALENHTYASAGTYTVTLTVTDDDGAEDSDTEQVTVTEPGTPAVLAADAFGRSVVNGWGSADTGGAWSTTGSTSNYSVTGGVGRHRSPSAGITTNSYLNAVDAGDLLASVDIAYDSAPTGSGVYTSLLVRRNGSSEYRARIRAMPSSTTLSLMRVVSGSTTVLASTTLPGVVYSPGDVIRLELQATGSGTTSLSAKAWELGGPEPGGWQVSTNDSTAALQSAGGVGVSTYLSGSSTNTPLFTSYDNLVVTQP